MNRTTLVFVRRRILQDSYEEEQKHQREIYDAMMEAKRADRSKSEFLEHIVMKIRTPRNSIIGHFPIWAGQILVMRRKFLKTFDKIEMSAQFYAPAWIF